MFLSLWLIPPSQNLIMLHFSWQFSNHISNYSWKGFSVSKASHDWIGSKVLIFLTPKILRVQVDGNADVHIFELGQVMFFLSQAEGRSHKSIVCWLRKKIFVDTCQRPPGFSLWGESFMLEKSSHNQLLLGMGENTQKYSERGRGMSQSLRASP